MKKTLVSFTIALVVVALFSCDKISEVTFTSKTISAVAQVSPVADAGEHTYIDQTFNFNLDSIMKANKTSLDNLKKINVKKISVELKDPGTGITEPMVLAWSSVEWIEAYFSAGSHEHKVGFKNPMPMDGSYWIDLNVTGTDLINIFKETSYKVKVKGSNNAPIDVTLMVQVAVMFEITGGGSI